MPKGRHLKPEFFTDKHIVSVTPLARLLYQGLWCYAADCGHLEDEPVEFKMRILPADSCDVDALLDELVGARRITRDAGWIGIPTLRDHGRIDKRYETICTLCKEVGPRSDHGVTPTPADPNHGVTTTGTRRDHAGPQANHAVDGDGDGDGDVKVMVKGARKRPATPLPNNWKPTPEHLDRALNAGLTLGLEVDKFKAHADTHDRRAVNWNAAFTQWLIKAEEFRGGRPKPDTRVVGAPVEAPPDGLTDEEAHAWYDARARRA